MAAMAAVDRNCDEAAANIEIAAPVVVAMVAVAGRREWPAVAHSVHLT